jgi:hypothetical protein
VVFRKETPARFPPEQGCLALISWQFFPTFLGLLLGCLHVTDEIINDNGPMTLSATTFKQQTLLPSHFKVTIKYILVFFATWISSTVRPV